MVFVAMMRDKNGITHIADVTHSHPPQESTDGESFSFELKTSVCGLSTPQLNILLTTKTETYYVVDLHTGERVELESASIATEPFR